MGPVKFACVGGGGGNIAVTVRPFTFGGGGGFGGEFEEAVDIKGGIGAWDCEWERECGVDCRGSELLEPPNKERDDDDIEFSEVVEDDADGRVSGACGCGGCREGEWSCLGRCGVTKGLGEGGDCEIWGRLAEREISGCSNFYSLSYGQRCKITWESSMPYLSNTIQCGVVSLLVLLVARFI